MQTKPQALPAGPHFTPKERFKQLFHCGLGDRFTAIFENGGEPIPEAAMEKLFEPFFRGEVRASRQGLGLGLHIASQIAKAHDGVLTVTSTPEETRFVFVMPLR